ncbi:MAG: cation transporter [Thermoproteota archaeon]|nr:cation transporter [Thermoproteota archaeon]
MILERKLSELNNNQRALTSILRVGQGLHDDLFRPYALRHRLRQSPGCTLPPCARYLNLWEGLPAAKSSSHISNVISLYRAIQMRNIANRHNLLSLKTDAKNSIKDGSASVVGFLSVLIATQFGFSQMDAIGGIIIAGYIFSVAYVSLRQSSLILVDSWQNPKATDLVRQIIEDKFKRRDQVKVRSILLRPAGMMVGFAAVHIELDGNKRLADVELLTREVEIVIRSKIPYIKKISVIPHSSTSLPILSESTSI